MSVYIMHMHQGTKSPQKLEIFRGPRPEPLQNNIKVRYITPEKIPCWEGPVIFPWILSLLSSHKLPQ